MNANLDKGITVWFIHNPVAANLLMLLIIGAGVFSAMSLRREGFPSIPPNQITIEVAFPGGSPELTEESVTLKVEQALRGAEGIKRVTATSGSQSSSITVEKEEDFDLDQLLTEVKNRVDAIPNLPNRAERPVIAKQHFDDHVIWVQVFGDVEIDTLDQLARDLKKDLERLGDVRRIQLAGERSPEIHIELHEQALQKYQLSLADISQKVTAESFSELSGQLRGPAGEVSLKADRRAYYRDDFAQIPIRSEGDGRRLYLEDVANIQDRFAESPHRWMRFQGKPSIGLQIFKNRNGSTQEAVIAVEALLDSWRDAGRVPENVALATWNDRSLQVTSRISLLFKNALLGVGLVFLILALTIDPRYAFWVAVGLPTAFGGALIFMGESLFNLSINELTTFGMIVALGIVVDDAVVIGESVFSTKQQNGPGRKSTILGVHRVAAPTVFGVLTTVAAFAVLPLIKGEMGQIFAQFSTVVAVALIFSIIESKLILPAHLDTLEPNTQPKTNFGRWWRALREAIESGFHALAEAYGRFLKTVLTWRYSSLLVILTLGFGIFGLYSRGFVRAVFFPDIATDVVTASLYMEDRAGYGLTKQHLHHMETSLQQAVNHLTHRRPESLIKAVQVEQSSDRSGQIMAELVADELRTISAGDLAAAWRERVGVMEGVASANISASFENDKAIRLRVSADNNDQLAEAMQSLESKLNAIAGVIDVRNHLSQGRSEIQLDLREVGRADGFTSARMAEQIQQSFFGYEVQRIQRGQDETRVRIRYPESQRENLTHLEQTWIRDDAGRPLPLQSVVDMRWVRTPVEITRVDGRGVAILTANVNKQTVSPEEVMATLDQTVIPQWQEQFPGVSVIKAGEAEEMSRTLNSFLKVLLLALAMIYTLIAIPLKSYTQPFIIMGAIPFGILGAVFGHWIHGVPVSLLSMFGMLALAGVVVNDSLLLMVTYNRRRSETKDPLQALVLAGKSRLRAIILTSVTTYAGLVPLVWETSEQAQYLIPAAISLAYGVLFATVLTLVVIPVLQAIGHDANKLYSR